MHIIGYIGLVTLAASWVPQTFDTIKEKHCRVNGYFLVLNSIGSFSLMLYSFFLGDMVFSILNSMTSVGALINIFYKVRTRISQR
ncbi:MAG: PQ-loop domain-containing transporter [Ignavibacteriaceae bacterium]|jgi:MtN3 and saliva related transmembrane protein